MSECIYIIISWW